MRGGKMKVSFGVIVISLVILSLLVLGAGCQEQPVPPTGQTYTVEIKDSSFNPQNLTIKAGDTVTWTNNDSVLHDITIDNGLFDHDLNPGESYSWTFNETGTYDYHCDIHVSMIGKIIVI